MAMAMTTAAPEPAQEPVSAWLYRSVSGEVRASHLRWRKGKFNDGWTEIPLYAAPPSDARDAARYRWLRSRADDCAAEISFAPSHMPTGEGWVTIAQNVNAGTVLDTAIDAAIAAEWKR